ncbi:MAG: DUF5678 domain-containing protein [Acidobacteriia bacterium]|nr:DUF5678 domain-containing protein [Terriglobia bacterium]
MTPQAHADLLRSAPLDKWIALSSDESRIVAVGDTFADAATKAHEAGEDDPLILKMPPQNAATVKVPPQCLYS